MTACFCDVDVGHAVFGEQALVLGDEQQAGVAQRDEAELGALVTSGPASLCERAGGEIQLGGGEQMRPCRRRAFRQLTAAQATRRSDWLCAVVIGIVAVCVGA